MSASAPCEEPGHDALGSGAGPSEPKSSREEGGVGHSVPQVEVLQEAGMTEDLASLAPGAAVFRQVRLTTGSAAGWQVWARLELDRHHGKESSRAPRYQYLRPDGKAFKSLHGTAWNAVQAFGGLNDEGFSELAAVQRQLKAKLTRRKADLERANLLINREAEDVWQEMLRLRGAVPSRQMHELREKYDDAPAEQRAPLAPEWRPPEWEGGVTPRKRLSSDGSPDAPAAPAARPVPSRRRRNPFVAYILHKMRPPLASSAAPRPDAAAESEEEEACRSDDEEGEKPAGREKKRRQPEGQEESDARAPPPSVRIIMQSEAAAERQLETAAAEGWHWEQLLNGGALRNDEDDPETSLIQADPEVAWLSLTALASLRRATDQLPFVASDILRAAEACASAARPMAPQFAPVLVVQDALRQKGDSRLLVEFTQAMLRHFIALDHQDIRRVLPGLVAFVARCSRSSRAEGVRSAMKGAMPGLAPLCAFAVQLAEGVHGAAEGSVASVCGYVMGMLRAKAKAQWHLWQNSVAVLVGLLLSAKDRRAWDGLKEVLYDLEWPARSQLARYELWLALLNLSKPVPGKLLPKPIQAPRADDPGAAAEALRVYEGFLQGVAGVPGKDDRDTLLHGVALRRACPLCALLGDPSTLLNLDPKLESCWVAVLQLESQLLLEGRVEYAHAERREEFGRECRRRAERCLAFLMARSSHRPVLPELERRLKAAAAAAAGQVALLFRVDSPSAVAVLEKFFGDFEAAPAWPVAPKELRGQAFRSESDKAGPSFSAGSQLVHLNGRLFERILDGGAEARNVCKWVLAKTLKPAEGRTNPEVNRFACWLAEVFEHRAPLLRMPRPPDTLASAAADEELKALALRAQALCDFFSKLPATSGGDARLRGCALGAALQGLCLLYATKGLERGGSGLWDAVGKLLGSTAGSIDQVLRLAPATSQRLVARLARDAHRLLLWVERLEAPARAARTRSLLSLCAAVARQVEGRWPPPPNCPSETELPCAARLAFDPTSQARLPASAHGGLREEEALGLCPPASVLTYREVDSEAASATVPALLRATVTEAAAAVAGSDAYEFVRLRGWRSRVLSELAADPAKANQRKRLLAAISSRCKVVIAPVEMARFRTGRVVGGSLPGLMTALVADLGEDLLEQLLEYHTAVAELLKSGAAQGGGSPVEAPWGALALVRRYEALKVLAGVTTAPVSAPLARCLAELHGWLATGGMAEEPSDRARRVAQNLAAAAAEVAAQWRSRATRDCAEEVAAKPPLLAGEVAPPLSEEAPTGGGVLKAALDAIEGSPLEQIGADLEG